MQESLIRVERTNTVTKWSLQRPRRGNGIGPSVADHFTTLLEEFREESPPHHVLVITADPIPAKDRRIWIAGGDLKELSNLHDPKDAFVFARKVSGFLEALRMLPTPVIFAIDGDAIGGGAEFALGGDIRLATAASRFDFKQTKMGLPTGFGGAQRLAHLLGITRAETLIYGAKTITALEALEWGLIHAVARDAGDLAAQTQLWVDQLLSIDPRAFAAQKLMFHGTSPHAILDEEARLFSEAWNNPTHRRRLDEFLGAPAKTPKP